MESVLQFINDSGFVGWCIMLIGIGSIALIVERTKVLYFKYGMNTDEFMAKVQSLVLSKKTDEALLLCNQMNEKPLAQAFKTILEKSDRDDDTIFQAHDIAMAECVPQLTKRVHYLSMLSNVATLAGLLGTIHGLIISFAAVAQADASQKQAMLAHGISVSMYTTALGLVVAIPAMVAFSFLISRQNQLVDELVEKTSKLTELLTGSHIPSLTKQAVFPDHLGKESLAQKAPPSNVKAS